MTAEAAAVIISGSGDSGTTSGFNGNLYLSVTAVQSANQSTSNKTTSSGAAIYGSYYDSTSGACWFGFGSSTSPISFNGGVIQKAISASGSIPINWYEYCVGLTPFQETVAFNMNLSTTTAISNHNWGTTHQQYGNMTVDTHDDSISGLATASASSFFTSPAFGTVIPNSNPYNSTISLINAHTVQITH